MFGPASTLTIFRAKACTLTAFTTQFGRFVADKAPLFYQQGNTAKLAKTQKGEFTKDIPTRLRVLQADQKVFTFTYTILTLILDSDSPRCNHYQRPTVLVIA